MGKPLKDLSHRELVDEYTTAVLATTRKRSQETRDRAQAAKAELMRRLARLEGFEHAQTATTSDGPGSMVGQSANGDLV